MPVQPSSAIVVRPLRSDDEIAIYNHLAAEAFWGGPDIAASALRRRASLESMPEFDPAQQRGAFEGDTLLAGYTNFERHMHIGSASVLTGCIGAVVTHPGYRMRGAATAMLRDAIAFAEQRGHGLLLLDGIPNFYQRFGFTDVLDETHFAIRIESIPVIAPEGYSVVPASTDSAHLLLDLYNRHYGGYTGSFARGLAQQQWRLLRTEDNPRLLAIAPDGTAEGYLIPTRQPDKSRAVEVAADSWPAALALLQHHARVVAASSEPSDVLWWPLPPDATTAYLLADNLGVAALPPSMAPLWAWAVKGETYALRPAGWMARLVDLPRVLDAMVPELTARWRRARLPWSGAFTLAVGPQAVSLDLRDDGVSLLEASPEDAPVASLTPQDFTRLLFGYRPLTYLAAIGSADGPHVPKPLVSVLDALFPTGNCFIPGTDGF